MHESGLTPTEPSAKIWRYETLSHLLDELDNGYLHFANAHDFKDTKEGQTPEAFKMMYRAYCEAMYREHIEYSIEDCMKKFEKQQEQTKYVTFVSCWHLDRDESLRRWCRYQNRAVAIQSTYLDLESEKYDKRKQGMYHVSKVTYVNHLIADVSKYHPLTEYTLKDWVYECENELRAFCVSPAHNKEQILQIRIDLDKVLKRIMISPWASETVRDKIFKAIKRNGLNIPIQVSKFRSRTR